MALNIKDAETERLAAEVAALTGENKTQAVRAALRERQARLALERGGRGGRRRDLARYLEAEIWSMIPPDVLGTQLTKVEEEELLGIGPEGA